MNRVVAAGALHAETRKLANRIAEASGLGLSIDLDRLLLSAEGRAWLDGQPDRSAASVALATGGDDYAIVCAVDPAAIEAFVAAVAAIGVPAVAIGAFEQAPGMRVMSQGAALTITHTGWRHS